MFGGEQFLQYALPDYGTERTTLLSLAALAMLFWWGLVPLVVTTFLLSKPSTGEDANDESTTTRRTVTRKRTGRTTTTTVVLKRNKKKQESSSKNKTRKTPDTTTASLQQKQQEQQQEVNAGIHLMATIFETLGCLMTLLYLVGQSSNNNLAPRGVWEAPLFSPTECQMVLDMAEAAAQRNHQLYSDTNEALARDPVGWQKSRHASYPTIDLNLVTDPFTDQDREWLQTLLDKRLAPLLERIYGVVPSAIRANDMFVVRYDAAQQPFLARHTDEADISFNILLSDTFQGGGTRFWNRLTGQPFVSVQPSRVGQVLTHSALLNHEGLAVTEGLRYILVGFLSVDRMDPITYHPTGLSWFASYWSIPYLHNKIKEGYTAAHSRLAQKESSTVVRAKWRDHRYVRSLFLFLVLQLQTIGDELCPHVHYNLVREDDAQQYLQSLDDVYEMNSDNGGTEQEPSKGNDRRGKSLWFEKQQLNLDVDGTVQPPVSAPEL